MGTKVLGQNYIRNIVICLIIFILLLTFSVYFFLIFGLPKILNSPKFINKIENLLYEKTRLRVAIQNVDFIINPNLQVRFRAGKISADYDAKKVFEISGLESESNLLPFSLNKIYADSVYANIDNLKPVLPKKNINKNKSFNLSKIPDVYIKKLVVVYNKNSIKSDKIIFIKTHNDDLIIRANDIPVNATLATVLYFQKLQDPKKKFLENFRNYGGTISLNLRYGNNFLNGKIAAQDLRAITVLFNVPIYFKKADFDIVNNELNSKAVGTLGTEKVEHYLNITNLLSAERVVNGSVNAALTDKMSKKYLPENIRIKKHALARVDYNIKNKKIDVKYFLNLPPGADLLYKNAYLGLRKRERRFFARTYKDNDNLYLKTYDYSTIENRIARKIISGNGLFISQNGHLTPQWITCTTNGYAPVSVTGSFGRYVQGGKFKGNLKYDFIKKTITGDFEVIKTVFNNFFVRSAKVTADENLVNITANGRYLDQKFLCGAIVKNDFTDKIIVHSMNLFLDRFNILRQPQPASKRKSHKFKDMNQISSKVREIDMDIENWNIKTNTLTMDNIVLNNIELFGSLKDSIFQFFMPELSFANGLLSANGKYNFNDNSSSVDFSAKNIDSNIAAEMLFELKDQIQGIANATLQARTYNNLEDIKAAVFFEINDGFLPKLGNTEFMVSKFRMNKKIKISSLTNVDLTKAEALSSDIKGSFDFNNYKLENIVITSQHKSVASLINGSYDIKLQDAEVNVYGKYDKLAPRGVKILFIPLNWLIHFALRNDEPQKLYKSELDQIPEIEGQKKNEKYFKIKVKGNLNTEQINVDIKGLSR